MKDNTVEVENQDESKMTFQAPVGMQRKREPSFSGIMNGSVDSILSSKMTAPVQPPKIHTQMCDVDSDEGGRA